MTASPIGAEPSDVVRTPPDLGSALHRLSQQAIRYAAARVESWVSQLNGIVEPEGAMDSAVVEGVKAWVTQGGNPAWAALKGAWSGADGKTRAAIIALLVLLAVLAPVLLLLLALALLVVAVVQKARAVRS